MAGASTEQAGAADAAAQAVPSRSDPPPPARRTSTSLEVLWVATRLGLTSFGGPIAHLGYFHAEYVARRRWLDDRQFADLVAFCQFLPGPSSSQVGIAIGMRRAGLLGGLLAWLGFTMPSAIALIVFAYLVRSGAVVGSGWRHGLEVVVVAVVAQAVWSLGRISCTDRMRSTLALLAAILALVWATPVVQVAIILGAGIVGWRILPITPSTSEDPQEPVSPLARRLAPGALLLLALALAGLPLLQRFTGAHPVALFDSFFRTGALVFGGGHVVLPLLQAAVVPPGWVSPSQFITGYGAAQAVPGPLFTFAAYLGAVEGPSPNGWMGGLLALVAIFLPSFLLVGGLLPFWDLLRRQAAFQSALRGINAAVVGLLLAALYNPIWVNAIRKPEDLALALAAFGLLQFWKVPPWLVVLLTAVGGAALPGM